MGTDGVKVSIHDRVNTIRKMGGWAGGVGY
uniref:Uncharacterized protein n=1 Tax=Arundo donax TaxID=35708 RepID=A0A0A9AGC8_ARUDO